VKRLELADLVSLETYDAVRDDFRARIMAHKRNRRVAVGDRVTLLFEDRETIRFQVQEMVRVERIRAPEKVQLELDVYNELIPGESELSATLMIEIPDLAEIRPELDRLIGLDEHVALLLGDRSGDALTVRADFDATQLGEDRIAAVHYIRFRLAPEALARFRALDIPARLSIDHANYRAEVTLPRSTRHSLIEDLAGGVPPLLKAPAGGGIAAAEEHALFESEGIRVRYPLHPAGLGHVVVESKRPLASWLEAEPVLWGELQRVLQRYAREIESRHGGCRCVTDLHAAGARWHLFAPIP